MNNRHYNIYFHTHTISGVIVSGVLYVIFFAGSFSFFRHEIDNWQKNTPTSDHRVDFDALTDSLDDVYGLYGRDISFSLDSLSPQLSVSLSEAKNNRSINPAGTYFNFNVNTHATNDHENQDGLGTFLYKLHFMEQVNRIGHTGIPIGYYISGSAAFLFLFALITGLLLHWKKIVTNFYVFRPWEKLKTLWTDLHTALGVITYPFLFVFAVTGTYYNLSEVFSKPMVKYVYQGHDDALYADLGYTEHRVEMRNKKLMVAADINRMVEQTRKKYPNAFISDITLYNYGDESMQISVKTNSDRKDKFAGSGEDIYEGMTKKVLYTRCPDAPVSYAAHTRELMHSLHFGNYGGYTAKILNFLLGICGCMVIVSGVLIWLKARDKKNMPDKQRLFNEFLANIYISISLSMFPVTALAFIAVKFNPEGGSDFIESIYFGNWLLLSLLFIARKDNFKTNRDCLLSGGILGLMVPLANGIATKSWVWNNIKKGYCDLVLIDFFWLLTAVTALIGFALVSIHQKKKQRTLTQG